MSKNSFNIYGISDQHYNHEKVISLAERNFHSLEEMNRRMRTLHNQNVRSNDLVIFLGDCIWTAGSSLDIKASITALNGRKVLVKGNHDRKSISWYLSNGFDFVCDKFTWRFNGKNIIFIHNPDFISSEEKKRHHFVIHGHLHQNVEFYRNIDGVHYINLSVERTDYKPVNLIDIFNKVANGFYK